MSTKPLPFNLTSYDLLKSFAVIIMLIDHTGWYFFPGDMWWRAVGRIGFPVWFFLVGHSNSRDLNWKLWAGTAVLFIGNIISGMYLFPLSALATIIVIRLVLDPFMRLALYDKKALFAFSIVLLLVVLHTAMFVEYGTQALIMAMLGYMVRHRERLNLTSDTVTLFTAYALTSFLVLQGMMFNLSQPQFIFMTIGTLAVMGLLYGFKLREYPELTAKLPKFVTAALKFGGRHTLEIYVAHLTLFKVLAMILFPHEYEFLQFDLFFTR